MNFCKNNISVSLQASLVLVSIRGVGGAGLTLIPSGDSVSWTFSQGVNGEGGPEHNTETLLEDLFL